MRRYAVLRGVNVGRDRSRIKKHLIRIGFGVDARGETWPSNGSPGGRGWPVMAAASVRYFMSLISRLRRLGMSGSPTSSTRQPAGVCTSFSVMDLT
jgi:hypothetical protein